MKKDLKILVTYSNTPNCIESVIEHNGMNPAFDRKVYIPVLGSSATYTGKNNFFKSILHDDDGENISKFNQSLNEYSVIYWAGKNYEKLDNPEYIGHCHYRRMLAVESEDDLDEHTIIVNQFKLKTPISTQLLAYHSPNVAEVFSAYTFKFISTFPNEANDFVNWMSGDEFFACHMFIMHKSLFFKYSELMIKYINVLMPLVYQFPNIQDRSTTFIPERLTSYVISKMLREDPTLKAKQGKYIKLDGCKY